ncbi:MAG: hypothetical protein VKL97_05680 [Cyanobacteriota bacterium]|nr:hypothetical protein [Cyanobacteriota bacterium]
MKRVLQAVASLGLGCALLSGCSEAELPQRSLNRDDCLREVQLEQLDAAIKRCNQVVAQFPQDPGPRNERSLLLALMGDDAAACREIEAAHKLAQQASKANKPSLDPLLSSELATRRQSCQSSL